MPFTDGEQLDCDKEHETWFIGGLNGGAAPNKESMATNPLSSY